MELVFQVCPYRLTVCYAIQARLVIGGLHLGKDACFLLKGHNGQLRFHVIINRRWHIILGGQLIGDLGFISLTDVTYGDSNCKRYIQSSAIPGHSGR